MLLIEQLNLQGRVFYLSGRSAGRGNASGDMQTSGGVVTETGAANARRLIQIDLSMRILPTIRVSCDTVVRIDIAAVIQ